MATLKTFCFFVVIVATLNINSTNGPAKDYFQTVQTHDGGGVKGVKKTTEYKRIDYYAFRGIPYAEKPIGSLRFKAPQPIVRWNGTLDAFKYQNSCYQQSWGLGNPPGQSEDCLYLNIFVPAHRKSNERFAVMFFIHGGGFAEGSGIDYYFGPDFLIEKDVIVVTINYRLGAFGFLALGTSDFSGNMGLKDQQMALQWVNDNIPSFGGDCDRITVFGQSAGAVSTHYQVLSPNSRKLIDRAICMSGAAFLFYSYLDKNNQTERMFAFAEQLNASVMDFEELTKFLQTVEAEAIVEFTSQKSVDRTLVFDWAPVIENEDAIRPFLLSPPEMIYQQTRTMNVSMMFGYIDYESAALAWTDIINPGRLDNFLNNFDLKLPIHNFSSTENHEFHAEALNEIYNHYFSNATSEWERSMEYVNMISDLNMVYPIDKAARIQSTYSNTFYYEFAVNADLNVVKQSRNINITGAVHGDDLCYLFRCNLIDWKYDELLRNNNKTSETALKSIESLTELFTNFAKTGFPSVHGKPVDGYEPINRNKILYARIDNSGISVGLSPKNRSNQFWDRILSKTIGV